ncbi:hypothetical protein BKA82DRAFT_993593 [Pisolithus tinctorius]|uniref:Uncharacterized protein n=1 Tax=Pisolithus tinctorius Marx 270 TaxID=870435 RepID=A0A0C3KSU8_PISTI|nr:hypothetical protein BKA82DRAFT_993593 [Pisolithus tinctorius]KIO12602.1 hypothetical protein M404DRAFT_993593 [Pisolithus tinctorius Marx 270]
MSTCISSGVIARVTGASQRTVNHVLRLSHLTGSVAKKPLEHGRPRSKTPAQHPLLLPL